MAIKKRTITSLLSLILFISVFSVNPINAEAATQFVDLKSNQSSATSVTVYGGEVSFIVNNSSSSKPVHYNLYLNGTLHSTGLDVSAGQIVSSPTMTGAKGYWSIKLICGTRNNPQTGCQTRATITAD